MSLPMTIRITAECGLAFLDSEFHTPVDFSKATGNHPVRAFSVQRADFWSWGLYAPREGRVIQNRDVKLGKRRRQARPAGDS